MRCVLSDLAMRANFPVLLAIAALGCNARVLSHDPQTAAGAALQFARLSFVQGDLDGSYTLLWDDTKKALPPGKYREAVSAMHPGSRPLNLTATEFEPVPGQEMMYIFLHGQNGSESFYYRLVMQGTVRTGYKVAGLFRGSGSYPASNMRQKLSVSTSDTGT